MQINGFEILDDSLKKNGRRAYEVLCPYCKGKKIILAQTINGRKTQSCGCLINLADRLPLKYNTNYTVDKKGQVRNVKTGKPLKPSDNGAGYKSISIRYENKRRNFYIHRLVAEHFIKNNNHDEQMEVNHIDGNKSNNEVHNLEWIDRSGNIKHSYRIGKRTMSEAHKQKLQDGRIKREAELFEIRKTATIKKENRVKLNKINFEFRGELAIIHQLFMEKPTDGNVEIYKDILHNTRGYLKASRDSKEKDND